MKVLLTGATGFTGSHVLDALIERKISVRCYARDPEKAKRLMGPGVEIKIGDLSDEAVLTEACRGCDLLLNVASIGFGHAPGIIRSAWAAGVRRAVFVSTTAIFTQLNAPSKVVRTAAEKEVRNSGLDWTIVRPTMIYGTDRDRNICRLVRYIRRYPMLPVFGSGEFLMQPIYVKDLADAIVRSGTIDMAIRKEYNLAGREPITYNGLVRTVARLLGRKIQLLHIPYRPVVKLLQAFERTGIRIPLKAEQILRLNENKGFDWENAGADLGFAPRTFGAGVSEEIRSMGLRVVQDA